MRFLCVLPGLTILACSGELSPKKAARQGAHEGPARCFAHVPETVYPETVIEIECVGPRAAVLGSVTHEQIPADIAASGIGVWRASFRPVDAAASEGRELSFCVGHDVCSQPAWVVFIASRKENLETKMKRYAQLARLQDIHSDTIREAARTRLCNSVDEGTPSPIFNACNATPQEIDRHLNRLSQFTHARVKAFGTQRKQALTKRIATLSDQANWRDILKLRRTVSHHNRLCDELLLSCKLDPGLGHCLSHLARETLTHAPKRKSIARRCRAYVEA